MGSKTSPFPNRLSSYYKWVLSIVALLLMLWWGEFFSFEPSCPQTGHRYAIMFDAGSTGSRIHVYEFFVDESGNAKLIRELFEETKPGLSAFKDDATQAAHSISPLLTKAVEVVPVEKQRCTPIQLKATAGLRLLGHEKSTAILDQVEQLIRSSPFKVSLGAVKLMDGRDEGPFAWLTVNFLLGTLEGNNKQTAAVLDMGGASTQVVFVPDNSAVLDTGPMESSYTINIGKRTFHLYQNSYLTYGLKEAAKYMKASSPLKNGNFPCFGSHQLSFDGCKPFALKKLKTEALCTRPPCSFAGVFQPSLSKDFSGPIYAFSYFYDTFISFFNGTSYSSSVGAYRTVGEQICRASSEPYASVAASNPMACIELVYLHSILHEGYGLPDSRELTIAKKINGVETAWALGATLLAL